jgi:hypothetical protein
MNARLTPASILILILALLLALLAPARAQAPEKVVEVTTKDGHPAVRDARTGEVLLDYRGVPLFDTQGLPGALEPAVRVQIQPDGFDVVYTFRNRGRSPAPMATLKLGVITLGEDVIFQDMRSVQQPMEVNPAKFPVRNFDYPGAVYSPVTVFRNKSHAVGVSIQYPILEYQHDLRITLRSPAGRLADGPGGRGFQVEHALSAPREEAPQRPERPQQDPARDRPGAEAPRPGALPVAFGQPGDDAPPPEDEAASRPVRGPWPARPGLVPPGRERVYTVSVRFTRAAEEWVRTLLPYREFFRRTYGGVTYERRTGPINGVVMANMARISRENPYGWVRAVPRPDQAGYKPWADELKRRKGWSGFLVWMPTGMYDQVGPKFAFPYQIATRWTTDPRLASALDRSSGLASIPATGAELGLWFNRSLQVATEWNTKDRQAMDPDDPALARAAFDELDAATAAGVTIIGLDTFSPRIIPAWRLYPWLKTLRERYPDVTFATEPITFDILHTLAPTYLRGYDDQQKPETLAELYKIKGPHLMADFLLPGHETWGTMRYGGYRWFKVEVTPDVIAADARRLATWGFRPLLFTDLDLTRPVQAAESWRTSVPDDLWLPDTNTKK